MSDYFAKFQIIEELKQAVKVKKMNEEILEKPRLFPRILKYCQRNNIPLSEPDRLISRTDNCLELLSKINPDSPTRTEQPKKTTKGGTPPKLDISVEHMQRRAPMSEMPTQSEGTRYDEKVEREDRIEFFPTIALVRHAHFQTTAMYLEHALRRLCNLVTVYVDQSSVLYYLGSHLLSSRLTRKPIQFILNEVLKEASIDLLLVVDPVKFDLTESNVADCTAFYAIDNLISFREHFSRSNVTSYDHVFVAQKDMIEEYRRAGCSRVSWLPVAADPEIHRPLKQKRLFDICFVGNLWSGRKQFVDALQMRHSNLRWYVGKQYMHNMSSIYSASNMILNKSLCGDLNMRVFEGMASGRLLITDKIGNGLNELFTDGKELVAYSDLEEASRAIEHYTVHAEEREAVAVAGMRSVLRAHTYEHRARRILATTGLKTS